MGAASSNSKTPKHQSKTVDIVVEDAPPQTVPTTIRQLMSPKNLNQIQPYNSLLHTSTVTQQARTNNNGPAGTQSNWQHSSNNFTSSQLHQANTLFSTNSKSSKKKPVDLRQTTQLLENDVVNIVYVEPGAEPQNQIKDLIQHQKYLVLPKTGLVNADQKFMRVVRGPKNDPKQK